MLCARAAKRGKVYSTTQNSISLHKTRFHYTKQNSTTRNKIPLHKTRFNYTKLYSRYTKQNSTTQNSIHDTQNSIPCTTQNSIPLHRTLSRQGVAFRGSSTHQHGENDGKSVYPHRAA